MTTVEHGLDLAAIRADIDSADWEEESENEWTQVRQSYLGSVFALTPSGKYYLPFACSNLDTCPSCKGAGEVIPRSLKRRTQKKHAGRHARTMKRFDRLYGWTNAHNALGTPSLVNPWRPSGNPAAYAFIDRQPKQYRMRSFSHGHRCTACGGSGSREAYLDEIWREAAEAALKSIGLHLENGEGDACDLFAVEYRYTPCECEGDSEADTGVNTENATPSGRAETET